MIRIKCPKCATPLSVDDADAGGVGECAECGTRFRIPAGKPPAAARRGREDDDEDDDEEEEDSAVSRRSARGHEDDADDEEEEQDEPEAPSRRRSGGMSETLKANLIMVGIMLASIVGLGVAGIFIKKVAVDLIFVSVITCEIIAITVVRAATKEGGLVAGVCALLGILSVVVGLGDTYLIFLGTDEYRDFKMPYRLAFYFGPYFWSAILAIYVIPHWKDMYRFGMVWAYSFILMIVMFVAAIINDNAIESHRDAVAAKAGITRVSQSK